MKCIYVSKETEKLTISGDGSLPTHIHAVFASKKPESGRKNIKRTCVFRKIHGTKIDKVKCIIGGYSIKSKFNQYTRR